MARTRKVRHQVNFLAEPELIELLDRIRHVEQQHTPDRFLSLSRLLRQAVLSYARRYHARLIPKSLQPNTGG